MAWSEAFELSTLERFAIERLMGLEVPVPEVGLDLIHEGRRSRPLSSAGSMNGWQDAVAKHLKGNDDE